MRQENNMNQEDKKEVENIAKQILNKSFSKRIGDTPTDGLQLTPRKYVNMYGSVLGRPVGSITGQFYFDTTIGRPVYRRGDGAWVDGAGSVS